MLMRLNYVIVYTSDMQRSIAFYRDQLGFPVKMESPDWTEFHTGATTLALHHGNPCERPRLAHSETQAGEAHLGIEVLDIDKFYEEKKAKGVQFTLPPTLQKFGRKLSVFVDPDGLPISVTEEIG
ncbi:MAG: VOC family protein [Acidobacteria bacterium]|nr:VOC family protein [Acidobacteriota bacterium]